MSKEARRTWEVWEESLQDSGGSQGRSPWEGRPPPPSAQLSPHLPTSCLCLDLDAVRACLMTQLAAPGHQRPVPHHLQPGSARNSLGLLPSTRGLQPRVLLWTSGPCSGPAEAPRWGVERSQQGVEGTIQAGWAQEQVRE